MKPQGHARRFPADRPEHFPSGLAPSVEGGGCALKVRRLMYQSLIRARLASGASACCEGLRTAQGQFLFEGLGVEIVRDPNQVRLQLPVFAGGELPAKAGGRPEVGRIAPRRRGGHAAAGKRRVEARHGLRPPEYPAFGPLSSLLTSNVLDDAYQILPAAFAAAGAPVPLAQASSRLKLPARRCGPPSGQSVAAAFSSIFPDGLFPSSQRLTRGA